MRIGCGFNKPLGPLCLTGFVERITQRSGVGTKPSTQFLFVVSQVGWGFALRDPQAPDSVTCAILGNDARVFRSLFKCTAEGGG
jgi:hypothetical protein